MTDIEIPALSLVALVGASGSGKSTFAARHFGPFETVSSDYCRGLVANDPNDQSATKAAFELLDTIVATRLARGLLTVVDATNTQSFAREQLVALARAHDVLPVAIVLDVPEATCVERNRQRPDRTFGAKVVRRQAAQLRASIKRLNREGFRTVHVLRPADIEDAAIVRTRLFNDRTDLTGPFDIIGDVHGCLAELTELLERLGYDLTHDDAGRLVDARHPERTAVFLGDLVDRGPDPVGVLRLVIGMVEAGHALAVPGNHEAKLIRALEGARVQAKHGLAETLAALADEPPEFREHVLRFAKALVSHYVLDGGRLVVAHAGLKEAYHGRASGRVRSFALYGDTTGESDEYGLPVRLDWARDYRGKAAVVYGHTPVAAAQWVNNTICVDTGCAFGGALTALRYPERELVSVPAHAQYADPVRPLGSGTAGPGGTGPDGARAEDELLLTDVTGRRTIETPYVSRIVIQEQNAAGALEVMSRFAIDPRALVYLPPTMTPCATSELPDFLEHPSDAFAQFAANGVGRVICEEKHMGSRAVLLVCRTEQVARERFGIEGALGTCWTRTGRRFFDEPLTAQLVARAADAAQRAGVWDECRDWALFDCELLPWSAKAGPLIREQYAQVGAAAGAALPAALAALHEAGARLTGPAADEAGALLARTELRAADAEAYRAAYRRYVWPVSGLDGVEIAPFQLLATEAATFHDREHLWHLALADRLVAADPQLFRTTRRLEVATDDPSSTRAGIDWWLELTGAGGEGMVVKPPTPVTRGPKDRLVQPGVKVRGREYLRIIYGPDYTLPENLTRLRRRSLGRKASLAMREFALGLAALDAAASGAPLHRVHELVFAVLALESEPVDPRL